MFIFGDTISNDPSLPWSRTGQPYVDYFGHDPIAWSQPTDPQSGIQLNFFTKPDGSPLFVGPPGLKMGPDDIPNSGITVNNTIYLICNTGADVHNPSPHLKDRSVLVKFDEANRTFTTGRQISRLHRNVDIHSRKQGRFILNSLHEFNSGASASVLIFGIGEHRASDVYLCTVPAAEIETGKGTLYFTGLDRSGAPKWSSAERDSYPVVFDNPLNNQDKWPYDAPTIGNVSVSFQKDFKLWLMTFDGGRQGSNNATTGIYFAYAANPWGPWSTPQMIYNAYRDKGFGNYIYDPHLKNPGPAGPTIGWHPPTNTNNPPDKTPGGTFAPQMIERFTNVRNGHLSRFYTMSTWNPYTVLLMRSDFKIYPNTIRQPESVSKPVRKPRVRRTRRP